VTPSSKIIQGVWTLAKGLAFIGVQPFPRVVDQNDRWIALGQLAGKGKLVLTLKVFYLGQPNPEFTPVKIIL
jgi:hypothetical protein